jgi:hypothetical protein
MAMIPECGLKLASLCHNGCYSNQTRNRAGPTGSTYSGQSMRLLQLMMASSKPRTVTSKTVPSAVDGIKIYAEAIGDPSKPAIVFIHSVNTTNAAFCVIYVESLHRILHHPAW